MVHRLSNNDLLINKNKMDQILFMNKLLNKAGAVMTCEYVVNESGNILYSGLTLDNKLQWKNFSTF